MKAIGIILIVIGAVGIIMGINMIGDIGIAAIVGALAALVSGIGFILADKKMKQTITTIQGVIPSTQNTSSTVQDTQPIENTTDTADANNVTPQA